MKRFNIVTGSIFALVLLLTGCNKSEQTISAEAPKQEVAMVADNYQLVTGVVYPKQPIAPAGAAGYQVTVTLSDVSKMDVAATVIASTSFTTSAFPVDYSIAFDASVIKSKMSYALHTRITDGAGKLVGVTDQNHKYTLNDASIGFDILVKAVQLEAPIPMQLRMTCGEDNYSLAIYPGLLVKTDLAVHNQHILAKVVSASGEHYQSSSESIFMKGGNPPLVEINGQRISCTQV
jgi:putative lipoprotein